MCGFRVDCYKPVAQKAGHFCENIRGSRKVSRGKTQDVEEGMDYERST